MRNFILGMLIMLLIGAVGFASYQYGKRTSSVTEKISPPPILITESSTITSAPSPTITQAKVNDNDLIKQALFKKNKWPDDGTITLKVSTNDGKYASGTATAQGGGGYFYAVKDNGQWVIVADGNGVIECSSLTKYPDYPTTLIPECWDTATNKTVKR